MDDRRIPKVEVGRWGDRDRGPQGPRPGPGGGGDRREAFLARLESLAWLLDSSIKLPGLNYRVGLDAIIGLIPGIGDLVGTALSTYILVSASRMGIPRATLLRMGFNVLLEALVGLIPFVGDLFDFAWKANKRNIELIKAHLDDPARSRKEDLAFATLFLLVAAGVLGLLGWGMFRLGAALVS